MKTDNKVYNDFLPSLNEKFNDLFISYIEEYGYDSPYSDLIFHKLSEILYSLELEWQHKAKLWVYAKGRGVVVEWETCQGLISVIIHEDKRKVRVSYSVSMNYKSPITEDVLTHILDKMLPVSTEGWK